MLYIAIAAITGAGIVTGLLFAFSNFVMQALATLPKEQGMFAMQQINEKIINPIFLVFFLGTPILCAIITVSTLLTFYSSSSLWLPFGSVLYLVGPFGITMLFNVPLNNKLAAADITDSDVIWSDYQVRWQRWNHVRTYIGLASIVCLAAGLAEQSL